jgi:lipopolysaccharide exporter
VDGAPATTDGPGEPLAESLREATVRGVRWTSLVRLGTEILALASMVVLTHLVPPAEFGAVAVVMIVNEVANGLAGTGYGAPLVQRPQITRAHVQAVGAVSVVTSTVLALATVGVALVLPDDVFGARTVALLPLVAPMFLVSGLTIVPRALLERHLESAGWARTTWSPRSWPRPPRSASRSPAWTARRSSSGCWPAG